MADFTLDIGIDTGISFENMKSDISTLISRLNGEQYKVKVGVEIDQASIDNFRSQITSMQSSLLGTGKIVLGDVDTSRIDNAVGSVENISTNVQNAVSNIRSMRAELNAVSASTVSDALSSVSGLTAEGAANITRALESANVQIREAKVHLEEVAGEEQNLVSMHIKGTNEIGQSVSQLIKFDVKTGEIVSKTTDIVAKWQDVKSQATSASASMANGNSGLESTEASLTQISARLSEIQLANKSINAEYASLKGALGGENAAGRNASDVELMKQKYIEYMNLIEQVKVSKSSATQEDINNIYATQAQLQSLMDSIRERINLEQEAAKASQNASAASTSAAEAQAEAERRAAEESENKNKQSQRNEQERQQLLSRSYTLLKQMQDAEQNWTAAKNGKSSGAYTGIQSDIASLDSLILKFKEGTISAEDFKTKLKTFNTSFKENANVIRMNSENTKTWSERIGGLSAKFTTWFSITRVIMAAYRAIREMVSAVKELDTAMTELKKVTDETESTYSKFMSNASSKAKELGTKVSEFIESTSDFARLGYDIEDASTLAEVATLYKNVGDGISDISEASESIISTMQAFGIEASDAITIVDKFNNVGNHFAISSGGIGESLLRSASAMKAANNTLDETIALATAANTVIQDPEKVGTAMKTLSMYLRAAKTEAEDAGESTDGMASSVSELRNEILSLTNNKVDIQVDDNTFKSTYQIIKELATEWNNLSDITQANILEMIAGKRNSNVVSALLENFDIAEKALGESLGSEGSAMQEQEKWLESMEAKIQQLKASAEVFSSTLMNSSFLKGVIDTGNVALSTLTTIMDKLGTLPTLIGIVTAALSIKKIGLFSTIEDEATMSGIRITSVFSGISEKINGMFSGTNVLSQGALMKSVNSDSAALAQYSEALQSGSDQQTAFSMTMSNASSSAQEFAKSTQFNSESISNFNKQQALSAVSISAQNKSLSNVKTLLNTYNSDLSNCGMSQEEFISSVGKSNGALGRYLSGLNGAKASMKGYVGSLIAGKAATIGLKVATLALNTAIAIGVSLLVSKAISAISDYIHREEKLIEKSEEAAEAIESISKKFQTNAKTVSDIGKRFAELYQGVDKLTGANKNLTTDEYEEFLSLSNQLAEIFPTLSRSYDENGNAIVRLDGDVNTITNSLQQLLEVQRQIANQQIVDKLPDLYDGVKTKSHNFNKEIGEYKSQLYGLTSVHDDISKLDLTGEFKIFNQSTVSEVIKGLNEIGVKYKELGTNFKYENGSMVFKSAKFAIDYSGMSEEEIEDTKTRIRSKFQDLSDTYSNEIKNINEKIKTTEEENKQNWSGLLSSISTWLSTDDSYSTLNNDMQRVVQSMINNVDFSNLNFSKWSDLEQYIEDNIIGPMRDVSPEAQKLFSDLFNIEPKDKPATDYIKEIQDKIKEIADNTDFEYQDLLDKTGFQSIIDKYETDADEIAKKLEGVTKEMVLELSPDDITKAFDYVTKYGISSWEELKEALSNNTFDISIDIDAETSSIEALNTAMSESASAAGLSAESVEKLESRYKNLKNYDASKLFEKTANGIHINTKALEELESTYEEQNVTSFKNQLEDLTEQYDLLTNKIDNCSDASELADLYSQRDSVLERIEDTSRLATQYDGLTSAYQKWIEAQNKPTEREGYENMGEGYEKTKKLIEQGWSGDSGVTEYLDLLLSADQRTQDNITDFDKLTKKIKGTKFSIMDFFQYDKDNNLVSDGLFNFLDTVKVKLGDEFVQVAEDGTYAFDFTGDKINQVASALGMSTEAVQLLERAMIDAGFDVIFDSGLSDIEDFKYGVKDCADKLSEMGLTEYKFNFDTTSIDSVDKQIEESKNILKQFTNEDGTVNLDIEGATEAATILATLIYKKSDLENPTLMSIDVDTSDASSEVEKAIGLLQQFKDANANLEVQTAIGADTTDAQKKVDDLLSQMSGNQIITGELQIDTTSIDTALSSVNSLTPEIMIQAGLDSSKIDGYTPEPKEANVTYTKDSKEVDEYNPKDLTRTVTFKKDSIEVDKYNPKNIKRTVTYTLKVVGEGLASGTVGNKNINGIKGIAKAHGDWRTKRDGIALGGELGQELIVRDGRFFTIGDDSAEFFHYKKGDIIFNAEQTRQILNNGKIGSGDKRGTAFVEGTAFDSGSGGRRRKNDSKSTHSASGKNSSSSSGGRSSSKSSSSSTKNKSTNNTKSNDNDKESEFERQYKKHQHLLAMEKESEAEYLKWLNKAYKEAYKNKEIELDDYYKYQEEVYQGRQDLFKDHLSDIEHEISMRENYDGETKNIISLYKGASKDIEKEIAKARARGLDDTDDYIQELQSKWQDYQNNIDKLKEEAKEGAKDALDELVDYRIDMIKQDLNNEKDALEKKLDNLKSFYDRQKEALQDERDEEKYLKEQSEKRKSVSTIQEQLAMLGNDDSAWAQKRRLELEEELSKAKEDLDEFEDDHAYDMTIDALDKSYEKQEALIDKQISAIEEKLNNPKALYNQALSDIKNNTGELYKEMIAYNRKYGTGNDQDVKDIYNAAYDAFELYADVFGKNYQGIDLPNSTNQKPDNKSWDNEKISGTSNKSGSNKNTSNGNKPSNGTKTSTPSLKKGSTVKIKKTATHFGSKSKSVKMASFVPGSSFTVYNVSGDQVLIGKNGAYTGWVKKSDIVGYAKGTKKATAGLHRIDEIGSEYLFTSKDGSHYRILNDGDKVLNAGATDFLYKFANSNGKILGNIIKSVTNSNSLSRINPSSTNNDIRMGDIIINGNADRKTVSEIRRAQRENLTDVLKSLNKLNK